MDLRDWPIWYPMIPISATCGSPEGGRIGGRRNECVLASDGDLLMQWDDDDWMAQHRISYQTEAFLARTLKFVVFSECFFTTNKRNTSG